MLHFLNRSYFIHSAFTDNVSTNILAYVSKYIYADTSKSSWEWIKNVYFDAKNYYIHVAFSYYAPFINFLKAPSYLRLSLYLEKLYNWIIINMVRPGLLRIQYGLMGAIEGIWRASSQLFSMLGTVKQSSLRI